MMSIDYYYLFFFFLFVETWQADFLRMHAPNIKILVEHHM